MSDPYIGEIRMFGGNFAPAGWALCQGQQLRIVENQALFSLIGTIYGGDGRSTFALPDLRSRAPVHAGSLSGGGTYMVGQTGGEETATLATSQLPQHTHPARGTPAAGATANPEGAYWASNAEVKQYVAGSAAQGSMNAGAIANTGGGQPHDNMPPFVTLNFIIALTGLFPSRN